MTSIDHSAIHILESWYILAHMVLIPTISKWQASIIRALPFLASESIISNLCALMFNNHEVMPWRVVWQSRELLKNRETDLVFAQRNENLSQITVYRKKMGGEKNAKLTRNRKSTWGWKRKRNAHLIFMVKPVLWCLFKASCDIFQIKPAIN
jgi:hypothetical protein